MTGPAKNGRKPRRRWVGELSAYGNFLKQAEANQDRGAYLPSPEEIERETRSIRATWSTLTRESRCTIPKPAPVEITPIKLLGPTKYLSGDHS